MEGGKGQERNISAEYAQILCLCFCTHCLRMTVSQQESGNELEFSKH